MNIFPNDISIKIIDEGTNKPIPKIVTSIKLFTKRKNDYVFISSLSSGNGIIEIKKNWLNDEINKERNLFIMDYSSMLDNCEPKFEIKIMSNEEVMAAIKGWNEWKDILDLPQEEIDKLKDTDNKLYEPRIISVDVTGEDSMYLELKTRKLK